MLKKIAQLHFRSINKSIQGQNLFSPSFAHFFSSIHNFSHISNFLDQTSLLNSRNQIIQNLSEFLLPYFKQNDYETLSNCLKVLTCQIEPPMKGIELNLADNTLISTLGKVLNKSEDELLQAYKQKGDLAKVAQRYFKPTQEGKDITINELIGLLQKIVDESGKGSKERKEEILCDIFLKMRSSNEAFFFIRFLQKGFRIGMKQKSIISAIEKISKIEDISLDIERIETDVFGYSLGLKKDGEDSENIVVGKPLKCMLSRPANTANEVPKLLQKYGEEVLAEMKYDGERAQVHFNENEVNIFSRGLENKNQKYQYWISSLCKYFQENGIQSCILDLEIVPYDYKNNKILPFSDIMSFAKKATPEQANEPPQTDIALFVFDILYYNGTNLLRKPLEERKQLLTDYFPKNGLIRSAEGKLFNLNEPNFVEKLDDYFTTSTKNGLEGLIIKVLGSKTYYDTKGRTQWVKLKKNIEGRGLADTLDLIPIAGYWGKGKRANTFGAYLVGAYNKVTKNYEAICKLGTGFTDEALIQITESLKAFQMQEKPSRYAVSKALKPDVWFLPSQVWEIECDMLTPSPMYFVGKTIIDPERGLSLRFPRFIRIRTDKTIEQSTATQEIIDMYQRSKNDNSDQIQ